MNNSSVFEYMNLIIRFLNQEIDVNLFERAYLEKFKNETNILPINIFHVLDALFGDVDAYSADPEYQAIGGLNEKELREKCGLALNNLKTLVESSAP